MLEPLIGPTLQSISLEMDTNFPPINPHPTEDLSTIMYKAGQRSVVEWYTTRIGNSNGNT
tara:strand:+ start:950 stop:1129 length:180 start_codon:yes stop_codon:yes gene_type:complete